MVIFFKKLRALWKKWTIARTQGRGEYGSALVCSPRLSRSIFPVPRLDTEGLPAIPTFRGPLPTLLVSV